MIDHARYETKEAMGEGAQGVVVRVIDRERPTLPLVAKILRGARDDAAERRLTGEFALLARLRVPGLVRVHDFARDAAGRAFFVEDLVDGGDPWTFVTERPLDRRAAALAKLAADLGETLSVIHDAGFVHGDVKPANVRVPAEGRAMLLDLGAAVAIRATTNDVVLTPAFAAPEVRAGAAPSRASDVYSLASTLHACAREGAAHDAPGTEALREIAPWVPPSLADVIDQARSAHPADRPTALDLVAAAGRLRGALTWEGPTRERHVREDIVRELFRLDTGVTYVVGASGAGKSHVARELFTRLLLDGRPARLVHFPDVDALTSSKLVAFLRGDDGAFPFVCESGRMLVVLDDLEGASVELRDALDAWRCHARAASSVAFVATVREAPAGARTIALSPLDHDSFERLCEELGVPRGERARIERVAAGLPGWAVAAVGRVPLTKDAIVARVAELEPPSRSVVALAAVMGGEAPFDAITPSDVAPAFAAGLVERDRDRVALTARTLAADLADALADFDVVDHAASIALADDRLPASVLLGIAAARTPPKERARVLVEAASRARREESRSVEIDALLALVADPKERTIARLERLERATRDAGVARSHPRVLEWIEAAAPGSVLALRRRAEARAREGSQAEARELAERAIAVAPESERAYAHATLGAVALWAADWETADAAFANARRTLPASDVDAEEVARIEHNLGVVALYRGRHADAADAFERAIEIKRKLGDRAGVRACALNLGLARTKQGRFDESEHALDEALALAESLGQLAGKGWCLAARADLEVRRGRAREAERFVAEAEAIGEAVPKTVRADLAILRAEIALTESDGAVALGALAAVDGSLRADDALVDARCLVLESAARLVVLPVDRRAAARLAIAALRRARGAGLPDVAKEAEAALRRTRRMPSRTEPKMEGETTLWELLATLGAADLDAGAVALAKLVVAETAAERAFVVLVDAQGNVTNAAGADLDGLAVSEAEKRVDRAALANAWRARRVVHQPEVARLVVPGKRALVVAEHRFARGAFDRVSSEQAARWGVLADLVARLGGSVASSVVADERSSSSTSAISASSSMSTAMPRREVTRDYPEIVGRSPALRRALAALDAAVDTDLPVLVRGETGTGKELFARALHDHGMRRAGPFVAVNCAAIADALFEAELFGHARGAFTGADRARGGLLARAERGTLLLDEIGDLSPVRQATLLRVLESKRYRPVGSDDERAFDVRVVAATNRDLDAAVLDGTFRKDLLYRLRVLEIVVPPLRERHGDVEILFRHLLGRAGSRATIAPAVIEALDAYPYPGNVRELLHQTQRLAASGATRIEVAHLPRAVRSALAAGPLLDRTQGEGGERAEVERALEHTGGNISRAAGLLGLTRHGLKKRMLRLGLRAKGTAS